VKAGTTAAVALALCAFVTLFVGCRQATFRERVREQARERLLIQIKEEQAVQSRFKKVDPGTPAAAVLKEFGNRSTTGPCRNARECWFYDISQRTWFICFDQKAIVTCEGQVSGFEQTARMERSR
jgi:hypothetical protein